MDVKEIMKIQEEFQKEAFPDFWNIKNEEDFYNKLLYLGVALSGEVGEFNNLVKKLYRSKIFKKENIENIDEKIREEFADIFIYLLLIAMLLNIDIEKEFLKKLGINRKRFIE
jgi:NTP pyrophosphatase (non-canonical NTP hydrolase)